MIPKMLSHLSRGGSLLPVVPSYHYLFSFCRFFSKVMSLFLLGSDIVASTNIRFALHDRIGRKSDGGEGLERQMPQNADAK